MRKAGQLVASASTMPILAKISSPPPRSGPRPTNMRYPISATKIVSIAVRKAMMLDPGADSAR
ncbi:hypothetical protein [Sphingopyxis sp. PET50]|uniref:hypothetical protein n=1 Tax=Sphingopyxis sp. PET50 TaxID=2976533 RepID=UPI0021B05759|nr:hypothetical protein [Sphingopyxis sp. PET50]